MIHVINIVTGAQLSGINYRTGAPANLTRSPQADLMVSVGSALVIYDGQNDVLIKMSTSGVYLNVWPIVNEPTYMTYDRQLNRLVMIGWNRTGSCDTIQMLSLDTGVVKSVNSATIPDYNSVAVDRVSGNYYVAEYHSRFVFIHSSSDLSLLQTITLPTNVTSVGDWLGDYNQFAVIRNDELCAWSVVDNLTSCMSAPGTQKMVTRTTGGQSVVYVESQSTGNIMLNVFTPNTQPIVSSTGANSASLMKSVSLAVAMITLLVGIVMV